MRAQMFNENEIRKEMCEIGKRVYERQMVAANDGNFSARLENGEFLCTPTGISKGFMTPDCICKVDANCNILEAAEGFRPSSEVKMHLRVYRERPDVMAVVHAHPLYATSFAIAGIALEAPIIPEAIVSLGTVPLVPYGTPSTDEIPDGIAPYLDDYDALLLANHGAISFGASLLAAYHKMESLEFYARLLYQANMLGGARELDSSQVERLIDLRKNYGVKIGK